MWIWLVENVETMLSVLQLVFIALLVRVAYAPLRSRRRRFERLLTTLGYHQSETNSRTWTWFSDRNGVATYREITYCPVRQVLDISESVLAVASVPGQKPQLQFLTRVEEQVCGSCLPFEPIAKLPLPNRNEEQKPLPAVIRETGKVGAAVDEVTTAVVHVGDFREFNDIAKSVEKHVNESDGADFQRFWSAMHRYKSLLSVGGARSDPAYNRLR